MTHFTGNRIGPSSCCVWQWKVRLKNCGSEFFKESWKLKQVLGKSQFSGTFLSQERGHSSKLPFIIKRVWRVFCKECFINTPTSYLWKSVTQLHLKLWRSSVFILTYGRLQKRKKEKKKRLFSSPKSKLTCMFFPYFQLCVFKMQCSILTFANHFIWKYIAVLKFSVLCLFTMHFIYWKLRKCLTQWCLTCDLKRMNFLCLK